MAASDTYGVVHRLAGDGICLAENLASVRVLKKCGFTQIYKGPGNYQGKEEQIIKAIWKNYN